MGSNGVKWDMMITNDLFFKEVSISVKIPAKHYHQRTEENYVES